jgi:hypothetical protein
MVRAATVKGTPLASHRAAPQRLGKHTGIIVITDIDGRIIFKRSHCCLASAASPAARRCSRRCATVAANIAKLPDLLLGGAKA